MDPLTVLLVTTLGGALASVLGSAGSDRQREALQLKLFGPDDLHGGVSVCRWGDGSQIVRVVTEPYAEFLLGRFGELHGAEWILDGVTVGDAPHHRVVQTDDDLYAYLDGDSVALAVFSVERRFSDVLVKQVKILSPDLKIASRIYFWIDDSGAAFEDADVLYQLFAGTGRILVPGDLVRWMDRVSDGVYPEDLKSEVEELTSPYMRRAVLEYLKAYHNLDSQIFSWNADRDDLEHLQMMDGWSEAFIDWLVDRDTLGHLLEAHETDLDDVDPEDREAFIRSAVRDRSLRGDLKHRGIDLDRWIQDEVGDYDHLIWDMSFGELKSAAEEEALAARSMVLSREIAGDLVVHSEQGSFTGPGVSMGTPGFEPDSPDEIDSVFWLELDPADYYKATYQVGEYDDWRLFGSDSSAIGVLRSIDGLISEVELERIAPDLPVWEWPGADLGLFAAMDLPDSVLAFPIDLFLKVSLLQGLLSPVVRRYWQEVL